MFPRLIALLILSAAAMCAETRPARLDETPAPPYTLPDPLLLENGQRVNDAGSWRVSRRPELLELFAREIYGRTPVGRLDGTHAKVTSIEPHALDGAATRKEITVWFGAGETSPAMHLLLYVPNASGTTNKKWPVFLGLNFYGNHTIQNDRGITLSQAWMVPEAPGVVDHRATEAARGSDAAKWPVKTIVKRGYAVATVYCGDFCPDRPDGLAAGINGWLTHTNTDTRAVDAWGAIGVWAWGLSRALDYLATDGDVDGRRVALHGHSRLGKAALWAGAQDERFALVISNDSGCGGAALSKRVHGETVAKINRQFPHWFARNFRRYDQHEADLPVDQHELLALIAPRPLYVASAEDDDWADPRGEFLSVAGAEPVYRIFGYAGPDARKFPRVNQPVGDALHYHIRTGGHDLTAYDWSCYLDFADRWLGGRIPK